MKRMNPLVAIIILNWNQPAETANCIASVLAGDYARQRILTVDNGSTDDSVDRLRDRFGAQIEVLETGENLYYAGGNNRGLEWAMAAGADFALVINNDTLVAPDMVSRLTQTARQRPEAGVVAPIIYLGTGSDRIWALGSQWRQWLPIPRDIGRGEVDRGQYTAPLAVDFVTGCAMLVRRTVLEEIGLFDQAYQMYYEDADFCVRARQAGHEILVDPSARLWHLVSQTAGQQPVTSRYQRARYRARFYRQHRRGPLAWVIHPFLWGQEIVRAGKTLLRGQPSLASAGVRGLRDGYRERIRSIDGAG
jgi:GT2 family glycosyltransferase